MLSIVEVKKARVSVLEKNIDQHTVHPLELLRGDRKAED